MTYITTAEFNAEAYKHDDANKTVFDTADKWHALQDLVEGLSSGWTWVAGTRGTDITAYATSDAGARTKVTTTAAHNLTAGQFITIAGTTNYNDIYEVMESVDANNFTIDKAWDTNNDATGTYARGDSYICDAGGAGVYEFTWSVTAAPDAINKTLVGAVMICKTPCDKCIACDYFTKTQCETGGSGANVTISEGDVVCIVMKNETDTTDFTIKHANFRIHRIRKT